MDKNRIEGAVKQVKGSIKEAIGKVTGDRPTQAEGVAEKTAGKVQSNAGKVSDAVKDQLKK
ncbi:MAG: CsbD family protein [Burkholderia gladioli]